MHAAADGKRAGNYRDDAEALARIHQRKGSAFHTRISLLEEERAAGYGVELLRRMTDQMDIDGAFALLYVSHCLAPPNPLPANAAAIGWIDLNDVARKIGLRADTEVEAEANRRLVWNYIRFGARANIVGQRTSVYRDPVTGKNVDTCIDTPLWRVMREERPIQPPLFEEETVPTRVELVASRAWTRLTTMPHTAQYLPFGETLGAIPGKKAGGAWARSIGLAYTHFCRRNPGDALSRRLRPTREELLSPFPAKETPYTSFLDPDSSASKNPARLLKYWSEACQWLVDTKILAPEGEAVRTEPDQKTAVKGKYRWVEGWIRERVDLRPGPLLWDAVTERYDALPQPRRSKPGRPRKS